MTIEARYKAGRRRHSGTTRDALGNTVSTWDPAEDMPVIWAAPGAMDEPSQRNRDASRVEWSLCVPRGTVIGERDRVVWRGEEFNVSGRPRDWTLGPWPNPVAAVVVELKRTDG